MENEIISLATKLLDLGKAQGESWGFTWDNRHPTFRAIMTAFEARDLAALKQIEKDDFS